MFRPGNLICMLELCLAGKSSFILNVIRPRTVYCGAQIVGIILPDVDVQQTYPINTLATEPI